MPSLVVHLALAGLLAAGLLGQSFSAQSLLAVLATVVFADMDVFVGLVVEGAHRAVFHSLLWAVIATGLLYYDTRVREESWLVDRFGEASKRVAGVMIVAFVFAAIGLDFVTGGVNLLYPIHDQFYYLNGRLVLSNQRGLVQTFVNLAPRGVDVGHMGSTESVHMGSGFDPTAGGESRNVERIFPVFGSGWQLLLVVTSVFVVGARLLEE